MADKNNHNHNLGNYVPLEQQPQHTAHERLETVHERTKKHHVLLP